MAKLIYGNRTVELTGDYTIPKGTYHGGELRNSDKAITITCEEGVIFTDGFEIQNVKNVTFKGWYFNKVSQYFNIYGDSQNLTWDSCVFKGCVGQGFRIYEASKKYNGNTSSGFNNFRWLNNKIEGTGECFITNVDWKPISNMIACCFDFEFSNNEITLNTKDWNCIVGLGKCWDMTFKGNKTIETNVDYPYNQHMNVFVIEGSCNFEGNRFENVWANNLRVRTLGILNQRTGISVFKNNLAIGNRKYSMVETNIISATDMRNSGYLVQGSIVIENNTTINPQDKDYRSWIADVFADNAIIKNNLAIGASLIWGRGQGTEKNITESGNKKFANIESAYLNENYIARIGPAMGSGIYAGRIIYASEKQAKTFVKNDCVSGTGSVVEYIVGAGSFSSTISQEDANAKALTAVERDGQAYANLHGTCTPAAKTIIARLFVNGWEVIVYSDKSTEVK